MSATPIFDALARERGLIEAAARRAAREAITEVVAEWQRKPLTWAEARRILGAQLDPAERDYLERQRAERKAQR